MYGQVEPGCETQHVRRPILPYSPHLFYCDFVTELQKRHNPRWLEREWIAALQTADERDQVRKLTADNAREDASYFDRQVVYELPEWANLRVRPQAAWGRRSRRD
jgi:hypothetical protein